MERGSGSSPGSGGKGAEEMAGGGSQTSQSLRASLCPQRAVEETTGCRFHKYICGGSTEFRWDGTRQERGEELGDLFSSSGDRCSDQRRPSQQEMEMGQGWGRRNTEG